MRLAVPESHSVLGTWKAPINLCRMTDQKELAFWKRGWIHEAQKGESYKDPQSPFLECSPPTPALAASPILMVSGFLRVITFTACFQEKMGYSLLRRLSLLHKLYPSWVDRHFYRFQELGGGVIGGWIECHWALMAFTPDLLQLKSS